MPTRAALTLAAVAAVLVVVALILLRLTSDAEDKGPFAGFDVHTRTSNVIFVGDPSAVSEEAIGVYFMNIETGAVEGWYHPTLEFYPTLISGDNRFVAFRTRPPPIYTSAPPPSYTQLADRKTQTVYSLPANTEVVSDGVHMATADGRVLLRQTDAEGRTWFAVLALEPKPAIAIAFQADANRGLFSPDAARVALFGDAISIVYLQTGKAVAVERRSVQLPQDERAQRELLMKNIRDGSGFVFAISATEKNYVGSWLSYSWDGALLAAGTGDTFSVSPDGSLIAVTEPLTGGEPVQAAVLEAFDTTSNESVFRVVGVSASPGRQFENSNRWLADNSGLVVSSSGIDPLIAMRDGTIRIARGIPSPTDAAVFASTFRAVDGAGNPINNAVFAVRPADFFSPWGDIGSELRLRLPHGGHDCCGARAVLMQPYVEAPPYTSDAPRVRLRAEALGLELWDQPAGTRAVGRISDPRAVVVLESRSVCINRVLPIDDKCAPAGYDQLLQLARLILPFAIDAGHAGVPFSTLWVRVKTDDGQEGWLLWSLSPNSL